MKKEFEEQLIAAFPVLCKHYRKDALEPFYYGFECGDGWYDIVFSTLLEINNEVTRISKTNNYDVYLLQVKEKFGSLRIHISYANEIINHLILRATLLSQQTCVWCGSQTGVTTNRTGFIRSMCPECMKKYEAQGFRQNGEF